MLFLLTFRFAKRPSAHHNSDISIRKLKPKRNKKEKMLRLKTAENAV